MAELGLAALMDFGLLKSLSSRQMAVDLGTANTVIYVPGEGIVLDEPSIVAVEIINGIEQVRAVGGEAKMLMGKTAENVRTCRPLCDGVITDLGLTEQMIKHFIAKANGSNTLLSRGPEIVIGVPSASTEVERRAIQAAAINAGVREAWLIEKPVAAAIGADLPVEEPVGTVVVDIGGGTTEVGIIALKRPTFSISERVGGDKMDEAIVAYVRMKHNLEIGMSTAERIKKEIGSALATPESAHISGDVGGREVTAGNLMEISLTQAEIAEALSDVVQQIVDVVSRAIGNAGAEIASDILNHGLVLTGGASMLRNIDEVLRNETGLAVQLASEPLTCVARGAARALTEPEYRTEFVSLARLSV